MDTRQERKRTKSLVVRLLKLVVPSFLLLLGALTWCYLRAAPEKSIANGEEKQRSVSTSPRRSLIASERAVTDSIAETSPDSIVRIRLLDTVSAVPLSKMHVKVVCREFERESVTDNDGVARLSHFPGGDLAACRVSVSGDLLGPSPFVTEFKIVGSLDRVQVLQVPAYAAIDVFLVSGTARTTEARVRVADMPPFPDHSSLPKRKIDELMHDLIDPEVYRSNVWTLGLVDRLHDTERAIAVGENHGVLLLPYTGEVYVTAFAPAMGPTGIRASICRGETVEVSLSLERRPQVRGIVVGPNGAPRARVRVNVKCISIFAQGETIPRFETEPGTPAFTMMGKLGVPGSKVSATLSATTDDSGRFAVDMPFTDFVTAWIFDAEDGRGLDSHTCGNRLDSVDGLRLHLRPPQVAQSRLPIVRDDGSLAGNETLLIMEHMSARDFTLPLPELRTDSRGTLDSRFLEEGARYTILPSLSHAGAEFVYIPGSAVTLRGSKRR